MKIVRRTADYQRMRWKNGAGWTTELAVEPAADGFVWRVSIAEIDADGEFSRFPGVDRSILVLAGAGMRLTIGAGPAVRLTVDSDALAFAGELPVFCTLLGGPTRDFNVMTRRGEVAHTLERAQAGDFVLAGAGLVYVVSGSAQVEGNALATGDSVQTDGAEPMMVEGEAALVVLRFCSRVV